MDRTWKTRLLMIGSIGCVSTLCYFGLASKYDPLARYPYGTQEQRRELLEYLSDGDIDYLINAQIRPEQVLPFAGQDGFMIENVPYYDLAMQTRPAGPDLIVQFVNQYRNRFDYAGLQALLSWMPYGDLIRYYDSGTNLPLVLNPADETLLLDGSQTVFLYKPSDLVQADEHLILREQAAAAWQNLVQAAAADGIALVPLSGYLSYEQQKNDPDRPGYVQTPYGTREEQLGLSVRLEGFEEWNASADHQESALTESMQQARAWIEQNAWKYGWIVRSQAEAESQPFVIRYVGEQRAAAMHENGLSLQAQIQSEKEAEHES